MDTKTGMNAFESQVNLDLLNDVIEFITYTTPNGEARRNLPARCIFLDHNRSTGAFQEKYGFLYLGEMLERYKERFGMSDQDRRALGLALGYTRDMLSGEMFVGNQREVFLQEMTRHASGDIYLVGALYLLNEGQSSGKAWLYQLIDQEYTKTEELLFAMSLLPDTGMAFSTFRVHLINLLGHGRSIPIMGNMCLFSWIVEKLYHIIKTMHGRDLALIRAFCALPVSFVKEDSRHHSVLLEYGYSPIEISYANAMMVDYRPISETLSTYSITTEKIVVDLFRRVLIYEEPFEQETYEQLSDLFYMYREFSIRCNGHKTLLDAIKENTVIHNPETFLWFSSLVPIKKSSKYNSFFDAFDVVDHKWDGLAVNLPRGQYLYLFETTLSSEMSGRDIQDRIDRYNQLTGESYIGYFYEDCYVVNFPLLVEKGIIDLWDTFQASLDENGDVCKPEMLKNMQTYLRNIETLQAFQFFEKFLPEYGFEGYYKYLSGTYNSKFSDPFIQFNSYNYSYNSNPWTLKLERTYLEGNAERQRTLLFWLEEYFFQYDAKSYIAFVVSVLLSKSVGRLLSYEERRALFDAVIDSPALKGYQKKELKELYLTEDELIAEQRAKKADDLAMEQRRNEMLAQEVHKDYEKVASGTIASLWKFMNKYSSDSSKTAVASCIVCEKLPQLLSANNYVLKSSETEHLLHICWKLKHDGIMSFGDIQGYISGV